MLSDPKIENIKIVDIKPNLDIPPFNSTEVKSKITSLLPSIHDYDISFYIKNVNTAIANGIKRIVQGELKIKNLDCEIKDIDTNEEFIKIEELRDRINQIPIDQDLPLDTQFAVSIVNTDPRKEFLVVHSSDLVQIGGKKGKDKIPFAETFRLAEIRPGKHLIISKIFLKEDYGFNHATHMLTGDVQYYILDFIIVTFLNYKSSFVEKRIKRDDLIKLFGKYKIKYNGEKDDLFRKKILVIPNKNYQNRLTPSQKKSIQNYDIIIENPEGSEVENMYQDDTFLKEYQSTETYCRDFFLKIRIYGNADPKKVMISICENIKDRLEKLRDLIIKKEENNVDKEQSKDPKNKFPQLDEIVTIIKDNIKTTIHIRGEDYTIGELIKKTIFELDQSIPLIKTPIEHPLNRTFKIEIIHAQPIKIILDAFNECIGIFNKIQKQFE